MFKLIKQFNKDESGATAIEYALIAGLIAVVIIAGATTLGTKINEQFENISTHLKTGPGTKAAAPAAEKKAGEQTN